MNDRDIDILEHIIRYCDEIKDARIRFGDSLEALQDDIHYKNSVSMCILQIGELSSILSDEFKLIYDDVPWKRIKGMRNIAAHHYSKFDTEKLWETITLDIPKLTEYCEEIYYQLTQSEQKAEHDIDEGPNLTF